MVAKEKESKELMKARRELDEMSRKETLALENAQHKQKFAVARARREDEEREVMLLSAKGKDEKELGWLRREAEEKHRLEVRRHEWTEQT